MTYSFDDYNYVIKLLKGERLSEAIEQFAEETKIEGGWIQGLGGTLEATLGFYDLDKKEYQWRTFEGLHELVSLNGNLAFDEQGKMMLHAHGVIADQNYQTVGGHIKDLVAGATVELFVHRTFKPLHRKTDGQVGLQTLDL
jgi:Predicted DNA-binding protein with PD1-like DNA-binding motif